MEANNNDWLEVAVFIHGITNKGDVEPHTPVYEGFLERLNKALTRRGKAPILKRPIMVEWGWERSPGDDRYLAAAERRIAGKVFREMEKRFDFAPVFFWARPAYDKLRETFFYGFDDLFYYVSEDGETTIRNNIFNAISREISERCLEVRGKPRPVSLTFFAHSAGSVIAHDLLFHLFGPEVTRPGEGEVHKVRTLVNRGLVRVKKLYTMGSPITALAVRSNNVIKRILDEEKLLPEEIGLTPEDGLDNPRWVNFWDKDDIFSYPVEVLYETGGPGAKAVIEDKYVDLGPFLGDLFPYCHHKYWTSRRVINYVAKTY